MFKKILNNAKLNLYNSIFYKNPKTFSKTIKNVLISNSKLLYNTLIFHRVKVVNFLISNNFVN